MTGASDHWLWRLDAQSWLAAASTELSAAQQRQDARRSCLTHLRRAAGMALNAVLVQCFPESEAEQVWGRSYIDHLRRIAGGAVIPEQLAGELDPNAVRRACQLIVSTPLVRGGNERQLVQVRTNQNDVATESCLSAALELVGACSRVCAA